jgi:RNA 2',3'-cyclic 3'-phosphodiesterase
MRLFVAADLGEAARAALGVEQQRIREALGPAAPLKWVKPDLAHLTLVFLGDVDDTKAPEVIEAMGRDIPRAPFEVALEGAGVFPPRGAPRVLWIGIGTGAAELIALQRAVAVRLGTLGIAIDDRAFHPHLTLARWKASRPADRERALKAARRGAIARTHIDGATLYQSRLSPSGSVYTPLSRANLKRSKK